MTRVELLRIVIGRAHENGFDFKRWYITCLREPWENTDMALKVVESQRRYYALLFHHEFAQAFWKKGETLTIHIAAQAFERVMPDGSTKIVERKAHVQRKGRAGGWQHYLMQMALQEEPLRYVRRFVNVEDEIESAPSDDVRLDEERYVLAEARKVSAASKTLELARRRAERRKKQEEEMRARQEAELQTLKPIVKSKSRRNPKLPGS